jgi:hypothetical protein
MQKQYAVFPYINCIPAMMDPELRFAAWSFRFAQPADAHELHMGHFCDGSAPLLFHPEACRLRQPQQKSCSGQSRTLENSSF